jgi:hypothetical protein
MKHFASRAFWEAYDRLPKQVRDLADRNYALLKENPRHRRCNSRESDGFGRCAWVYAIAR